MILTQEYSRVAGNYTSEQRAWVVSPEGAVYGCGHDHQECTDNLRIWKAIGQSQDEEQKMDLEWVLYEKGWAKIGMFDNGLVYLLTDNLNTSMFQSYQNLLSELDLADNDKVSVNWKGNKTFPWKDFRTFSSIVDMNKHARTMF